jgi:DNA ligase-1
MALRLPKHSEPDAAAVADLLRPAGADDPGWPYPFCLARPLDGDPTALGEAADWQVEWHWDGVRAQVIRRRGRVVLWSRGEELLNTAFPEVADAVGRLPDGTVLDGTLLAWRDQGPLPRGELHKRLGGRKPGPKLLKEVPAVFVAFDLLEAEGADLRGQPLAERRARLEALAARWPLASRLKLSEVLPAATWAEAAAWHDRARERGAGGLLLKRRSAAYAAGRCDDWLKWKAEPYRFCAVLVGARRDRGRGGQRFTDYQLAVWHHGGLVVVTRASGGLTEAEHAATDAFIREHVTGKFGPVVTVTPEQVLELTFEGIQASPRHKASLVLRHPRLARARPDLAPEAADTLEALRQLLPRPQEPERFHTPDLFAGWE